MEIHTKRRLLIGEKPTIQEGQIECSGAYKMTRKTIYKTLRKSFPEINSVMIIFKVVENLNIGELDGTNCVSGLRDQ